MILATSGGSEHAGEELAGVLGRVQGMLAELAPWRELFLWFRCGDVCMPALPAHAPSPWELARCFVFWFSASSALHWGLASPGCFLAGF